MEKLDRLISEFERNFPRLATRINNGYIDKCGLLIVVMDDGEAVAYDDVLKTIRTLPSTTMDEEEFRREFGNRLWRTMADRGITQFELSELTGITQPALSNYIRGRVMPSFYAVDKIAKALGCSTEVFRYF